MSQIFPAIGGFVVFAGLIGGGQALARRVIEGKWRETKKPDTFQYGLIMRDLAISDALLDRWTEANASNDDKRIYETKLILQKEYERELDNLILEVMTQPSTTSNNK